MFKTLLEKLPLPNPPPWVVEEAQRRILLLVNHVLMQEPEATARLVRQKGNVVLAEWRNFHFRVLITPAGLLDLAAPGAAPDLSLAIIEESPLALAQTWMQGKKPPVRIEGDVQLAAEINWLADHVRWDLEEDLSRVVGDAPAHWIAGAARTLAGTLGQWVSKGRAAATASANTAATPVAPGTSAASDMGAAA